MKAKPSEKRTERSQRISWRREEEDKSIVQQLGDRLRRMREQKGFSLAELSRASGVLPATLSRIENSKMSPTFSVLAKIMRGLQCDWIDVVGGLGDAKDAPAVSVVRRGEGQPADVAGIHYTFLHGQDSALGAAMIVDVTARDLEAVGGLVGHEGEEFCFVLRGLLALHIQGRSTERLAPGDSAMFASITPHAYVDGSGKGTQVLIVVVRRAPSDTKTPGPKQLSEKEVMDLRRGRRLA